MKNYNSIFVLISVIISFFLSGCGALYGNAKQYDNGDWYWIATSDEITQIKQDKLALYKLKNQPCKVSQEMSNLGYKGVLTNFNSWTQYNFIISGPEKKGYLLGPGESATDNLIPGTYICTVYREGVIQGDPWTFHVTPQLHSFRGKKYHWYVYME